jgi:hypothetical protein
VSEEEKRTAVFNKLIKIVPKVTAHETTNSVIAIRVVSGNAIAANKEFRDVILGIEVFVPWD